ncbi:MAG: hypothetical protein ACOVMN_09400, partial [Flexibacteraceae bacterium]
MLPKVAAVEAELPIILLETLTLRCLETKVNVEEFTVIAKLPLRNKLLDISKFSKKVVEMVEETVVEATQIPIEPFVVVV